MSYELYMFEIIVLMYSVLASVLCHRNWDDKVIRIQTLNNNELKISEIVTYDTIIMPYIMMGQQYKNNIETKTWGFFSLRKRLVCQLLGYIEWQNWPEMKCSFIRCVGKLIKQRVGVLPDSIKSMIII